MSDEKKEKEKQEKNFVAISETVTSGEPSTSTYPASTTALISQEDDCKNSISKIKISNKRKIESDDSSDDENLSKNKYFVSKHEIVNTALNGNQKLSSTSHKLTELKLKNDSSRRLENVVTDTPGDKVISDTIFFFLINLFDYKKIINLVVKLITVR